MRGREERLGGKDVERRKVQDQETPKTRGKEEETQWGEGETELVLRVSAETSGSNKGGRRCVTPRSWDKKDPSTRDEEYEGSLSAVVVFYYLDLLGFRSGSRDRTGNSPGEERVPTPVVGRVGRGQSSLRPG